MKRRSEENDKHIFLVDRSVKATRYEANSSNQEYFLDRKAVEVTPLSVKASSLKINKLDILPLNLSFNNSTQNEYTEKLSGDLLIFRKGAIIYIYNRVLGSPPPDDWNGQAGAISDIINRLSLPKNSRTRIKEILQERYDKEVNDEEFEKLSGRPRLIEDGSKDAAIIIFSVERGIGLGSATVLVNNYRTDNDLPPVSYSAVQRFCQSSPLLQCSKRSTKKSGKDDEDTIWANARVNQATQMLEELESKELILEAITFWDEKHKKCILGCCTKYEWLVCRDSSGIICDEEHEGKFPEKMPTTSVKFPAEARGIFGVTLVRKEGSLVGVRAPPYEYTEKNVVGPKKFNKLIEAEKQRVMTLKGIWRGGGGYEKKHGDNWRSEVINKVKTDGHICVTELMNHAINESIRIYENTEYANTFKIFHDGLTAWWEKDAQNYMESRGFLDRQIRNTNVGNSTNRYSLKVVGDSPEICRGLDAYGFAHLEQTIKVQVAVTSCYPVDDPRRFNLGTPKEVFRTMKRCWEISPTSEQIKEDILGLPCVLKKIVEARGCVIPDENFRTGRRARSSSGKKLKKNASNRQRVATNTQILLHPDSIDAAESLTASDKDIFKLVDDIEDSDNDSSDISDNDIED